MIQTYPSNETITKKHNFLGNVPTSKLNQQYLYEIHRGNSVYRIKCNVHPTQKDFNLFKTILSQWYIQGKKSDFFDFNVNEALSLLQINQYTLNEDNKRVSSNRTNVLKTLHKKIDNLMSFVIEIDDGQHIEKFHFIDSIKINTNDTNVIKIKLSPSFIQDFKKKKFQHVPLVIVKGEYQQKLLEFLLTQVQTKQNLIGIHSDKKFRFKSFNIEQFIKYSKLEGEYKKDKDGLRKTVSKSLKSLMEQINENDIDYGFVIPKYKFKNGMYDVIDYQYEKLK